MSIFTKLTWPSTDITAVCALQDATGDLVLNGTLSNTTSIPDQISFIANGMIRSVSITGSGMSGVNFTIKGFQNEALITEIIAGPSSGTIYGSKYYDIIASISTSATVSGVKIGTGTSGYLPLISVNTNTTAINYSFSVLLTLGSGVNYTMYQTLDSINTNFIPFSNQTLFPVTGVENVTTSMVKNDTAITNFLLLKVNSSNPSDKFDFIFLQE